MEKAIEIMDVPDYLTSCNACDSTIKHTKLKGVKFTSNDNSLTVRLCEEHLKMLHELTK